MRDYEEYPKDKIIEFLSGRYKNIKCEQSDIDPPDYWLYLDDKKCMLEVTSVVPQYYYENGKSQPRRTADKIIEQLTLEFGNEFAKDIADGYSIVIALHMPIEKENINIFKTKLYDQIKKTISEGIIDNDILITYKKERAYVKLTELITSSKIQIYHFDKFSSPSLLLDNFIEGNIPEKIYEKEKKLSNVVNSDNNKSEIFLGLYVYHPLLEIDEIRDVVQSTVNESMFNVIYIVIDSVVHEFVNKRKSVSRLKSIGEIWDSMMKLISISVKKVFQFRFSRVSG